MGLLVTCCPDDDDDTLAVQAQLRAKHHSEAVDFRTSLLLVFLRRHTAQALTEPAVGGPICASHKKGSGRWALGVGITQPAGFRELREVRPAAGSRRSIRSRNLRSQKVARRGPVEEKRGVKARGRERKPDCLSLTFFPSRRIVFAQVATRVEGKLVRKVQTPRATLVARRATTGGRCRTFGGEIALLGRIRNRDILTSLPGAITLL
jgi:hypothetical protein